MIITIPDFAEYSVATNIYPLNLPQVGIEHYILSYIGKKDSHALFSFMCDLHMNIDPWVKNSDCLENGKQRITLLISQYYNIASQ